MAGIYFWNILIACFISLIKLIGVAWITICRQYSHVWKLILRCWDFRMKSCLISTCASAAIVFWIDELNGKAASLSPRCSYFHLSRLLFLIFSCSRFDSWFFIECARKHTHTHTNVGRNIEWVRVFYHKQLRAHW